MREQVILLAISHTLASTLELQPGLILDQLHEIIEYSHAGLFSFEDLKFNYPGHAWDTASGAIPAHPHPPGQP